MTVQSNNRISYASAGRKSPTQIKQEMRVHFDDGQTFVDALRLCGATGHSQTPWFQSLWDRWLYESHQTLVAAAMAH